mgnify:CR=1 FL=1
MFTMMTMGGWIPQTDATLILGGENVPNLLLKKLEHSQSNMEYLRPHRDHYLLSFKKG